MRILLLTLGFSMLSAFSMHAQTAPEHLKTIPDLSPHLTAEQTQKAFESWLAFLQKNDALFEGQMLKSLQEAHDFYSTLLPEVTRLTIYSLDPVSDQDLEEYSFLSQNPESKSQKRFHGYPVYGTVEIDIASEARKWAKFLGSQALPGDSYSFCGFDPRHGFKLSTTSGDVDLVICFQCSRVMIILPPDREMPEYPTNVILPESPHRFPPMLSRAVHEVVNTLLDSRGIKRDLPEQGR